MGLFLVFPLIRKFGFDCLCVEIIKKNIYISKIFKTSNFTARYNKTGRIALLTVDNNLLVIYFSNFCLITHCIGFDLAYKNGIFYSSFLKSFIYLFIFCLTK